MSFQREIDIRGQNTSPATWTGQRIAGGAEADDPDAPSADGSQTVWSSLTVSDGDDAISAAEVSYELLTTHLHLLAFRHL